MISLNNDTLENLPAGVARFGYDRAAVRAGIAHIGVGNFHRAHQALLVDRCLHRPGQAEWGIVGIGLRDGEAARAKAANIARQDELFTLTEYAPDGAAETRVIGAMVGYLHAPANPEAVLQVLADPAIRIVTLTITEGGYNIDEVTGEFSADAPEIVADTDEAAPRTAFGMLVAALGRRRAAGVAPFTVVSCDNLRSNGDTARRAVVGFARLRDPGLASWIEETGAFPNSMVDRIAPSVSEADRDALAAASGVADATPVTGERFIQWVMEDDFPTGRPAFEQVGVELRSDVAAFEQVKGRLLNASHMLMSYPSLLLGHRLVHEALADGRIHGLILQFLERDAMPLVSWPAGVSPQAYCDMIVERFSNPMIRDQVLRVAHDGCAKLPVFYTQTLRELIAAEGDLGRVAFLFACFARYFAGRDDAGASFPVAEPALGAADLRLLEDADGLGLLRTTPFAALGLDASARFRDAYLAAAAALTRDGAAVTLDRLLAG